MGEGICCGGVFLGKGSRAKNKPPTPTLPCLSRPFLLPIILHPGSVLKYHRMNLSTLLLISVAPAVLFGADRMAVGLTRTKKVIEATAVSGASRDVPTVLLIGGLDGDENSVRVVTRELDSYTARTFRLLAIPRANPDKVRLVFPPAGRAYKEN